MAITKSTIQNLCTIFFLLSLGLGIVLSTKFVRAQEEDSFSTSRHLSGKLDNEAKRKRVIFFPKDNKFFHNLQTNGLTTWEIAWNIMQRTADDLGVEIRVVYPRELCESDFECVEPQIRLIAEVLKKNEADGMIIVPFDSNRLTPIIEKAVSRGIPVVGFDTPINSDKVTFVRFDNFLAAKTMGEWAVKKIGGRGRAVILEGDPQNQHSVDRRNGFLTGLSTGHIDVLDTETARWQEEEAKRIVGKWLKKFSCIDMIIAASDGMALGGAEAVAEAGRKDIMITGFDGWPTTLEAIRSGKITATVNQAIGLQARHALELLVRHLEAGEALPPVVHMPKIELITQDNIDKYQNL